MKEAAARIGQLTDEEWGCLASGGSLEIAGEAISADDVVVNREARGDVVIEVDAGLTVAIDHTLDEALVHEGWARELTSRLQRLRKDAGLAVTDRIQLKIMPEDEDMRVALLTHQASIAEEVLAVDFSLESSLSDAHDVDIEGHRVAISLQRA